MYNYACNDWEDSPTDKRAKRRRNRKKGYRKGIHKRKRKSINIGTWNVRTMGKAEDGKLPILLQELNSLDMNITGLCETRWEGQGKFSMTIDIEGVEEEEEVTRVNHTIYYSGNEKGGQRGVAVVLDSHHAAAVESFDPISDRILKLKINSRPVPLHVIQVYAPTSASSEEEIEDFYNTLQSAVDKVPSKEICIVMGDLNAKVGEGEDRDSGIGPFGHGVRNERGDLLANFCQANDLVITNTLFQQPLRRRYTWISPGDRSRNQIDYIMINRAWETSVLSSKTRPGADCDSDHKLVSTKLNLKTWRSPKTKPPPRFNTDILSNPVIAEEFGIETSNRFSKLRDDWIINDTYPFEVFKEMMGVWTETAMAKLGEKKSKKPKPWISLEVMDLAKAKSQARKNGDWDKYATLKKEIKSKVKRDYRQWLRDGCGKIKESDENRKSKEMFNQIKKVQKTRCQVKNSCIKSKEGVTLTEKKEVMERLREYGASLFKANPQDCGSDISSKRLHPQDAFTKLKTEPVDPEPEPLVSEVEAAIKQLKSNKAPGLDNIPAELIKHSGEGGIKAMHHLCCKIWKTLEWPAEWKQQEFVMLHKSGDTKDCSNYRTIALISHASKVLLIIILNRMKSKIEQELSDCQAGYRPNRGTIDMLFVLQNIIERVRNTQVDCWERGVEIKKSNEAFITFIDYSKAFDSVDHHRLFNTMIELGFPKHLVSLISSLYTDQKATIRWDNQKCPFFDIERGVRQGCILSPHLFNIYTEQVMRDADLEDSGFSIGDRKEDGGLRIGGRKITDLRYADDTALIADNIGSMRRNLHRVDMASREAGLKLNAKKTKVMHITRGEGRNQHTVKVSTQDKKREPIENVDDFKYLGSVKAHDGTSSKDILIRIGMAKSRMIQLNNLWKDHGVPIDLKVRLLKCLVWPVLLYGCEAWCQKQTDNKRIEACEMWFYRRLLRVSWKDKRTNEDILRKLKTSRQMLSLIGQRKLRYIGHATRNQETDLMRISYQGKLEAKRNVGRPQMTLLDNITAMSGLRVHEVARRSADRVDWRRRVMESCCTVPNSDTGEGDG